MAKFRARYVDPAGQVREESVEAATREEALSSVKQPGRVILEVRAEAGEREARRRVDHEDLAIATRALAQMVRSEVPINRAIQAVAADLRRGRLRDALDAVRADVEAGTALPEAFERQVAAFPPAFAGVVEAGIASGNLAGALEDLAYHAEAEGALRRNIRQALAYPTLVLAFLVLSFVGFMQLVAPRSIDFLERMAEGGGLMADDPAVPLLRALAHYHLHAIAGAGALALLALALCRTAAFAAWLEGALLRLPFVGRIVRTKLVAQLCGTLGTLLKAGVPISRSLAVLSRALPGPAVRGQVRALEGLVAEGRKLGEVLPSIGFLPAPVVWLVGVAEGRGGLPETLLDLARLYRERLRAAVDDVGFFVVPVAELVLGALVFGYALIAFEPFFGFIRLFKMMTSLR